jgi:hypothetical protein
MIEKTFDLCAYSQSNRGKRDMEIFARPERVRPAVFTGAKKQGGELVITLLPKSVVVLELK